MLRILALALTLAALTPVQAATAYEELAAAIRAGDSERVRTLLAAGTSAEATDRPDQAAPLLIAVSRGHQAIAERLLARGAPPNPRLASYYNATALMIAVNNRYRPLAEMLLRHGAEVNAVDSFGDPALNWATFYGDLPLVDLLLAHGARTDLVGHGDAVQVAMRRGHQPVLKRLLAQRGTLHTPDAATQALLSALDADDPAALRAALAAGARANGSDETGRPLLARAAREGRLQAVVALLEAGAAVDAPDPIGFTPLMEACREGHLAVAQALRAKGARVDRAALPSGLAMTPLHLAVAGERPALIRWLAAQGAPLDARDSEGAPPLAWAQGDERKALAELLLELGAQPLPPKT
ncbi:ankyrin repeat domain-containing protein [Inhella proteolytica]|uniref:Ankyrin repeat domain-containing protein n=1 Tax=Inhella proteolytica TaxID=2795029 RepID=A0A931J3X2_9BURK|nr:ankyrin repeat domain-containing protein [Inhella proteolytica]MBH9579144.1 ankyrin repeat domain-containing protein [Inhella proteolytica]